PRRDRADARSRRRSPWSAGSPPTPRRAARDQPRDSGPSGAGLEFLQHDADGANRDLAAHEDGHTAVVVGDPDHQAPLVLEDPAGLEDGLDRDTVERPRGNFDLFPPEDLHLERQALMA